MFVAVVVVCFWRSSWLAFLILTYYIKLMHQFLTPLSYLLWRLSYRSYRIFWKRLFAKNNFWVFLSVPHLLDNYAKIVDGRGRNFMCHRTLPSRLVHLHNLVLICPISTWIVFRILALVKVLFALPIFDMLPFTSPTELFWLQLFRSSPTPFGIEGSGPGGRQIFFFFFPKNNLFTPFWNLKKTLLHSVQSIGIF